jgi:hypothetical protein
LDPDRIQERKNCPPKILRIYSFEEPFVLSGRLKKLGIMHGV